MQEKIFMIIKKTLQNKGLASKILSKNVRQSFAILNLLISIQFNQLI